MFALYVCVCTCAGIWGGIVVTCLSHDCCDCEQVQLLTFGKLSLC